MECDGRRVPELGRILLGMSISRIGGSMLGVACAVHARALRLPALAGVVTFASVAPGLFISPIVGALLDRHGRTRLIIIDQLVGAACLVLIAVLATAGTLTPLTLVLVTAVAGLTAPLSSVGLRTLFPILVPRPALGARQRARLERLRRGHLVGRRSPGCSSRSSAVQRRSS